MFKFWFEKVVKEDERGFLYRDGAFVRLLPPGRHSIFDPRARLTCETSKVVRTEMRIERAQLFAKTQPALADEQETAMETPPSMRADLAHWNNGAGIDLVSGMGNYSLAVGYCSAGQLFQFRASPGALTKWCENELSLAARENVAHPAR